MSPDDPPDADSETLEEANRNNHGENLKGIEPGERHPLSAPDEEDQFSDEDFESTLPRVNLGTPGLDDLIKGGVPKKSLIAAIGAAGVGKTIFALQFLLEGLKNGEKVMFLAIEQSDEDIRDTINELSLDFDPYFEDNRIAIVDLEPLEVANKLDTIRKDLPQLVDNFQADRLVIDSVSVIEMMYENPSNRRTQVMNFLSSLRAYGVTTVLTSEPDPEHPTSSKYGIVEFIADAEVILRFIRGSNDFRETRMALEIQKMRYTTHSREVKPYAITEDGLSVYKQANIF